jgi:hypothetical protein
MNQDQLKDSDFITGNTSGQGFNNFNSNQHHFLDGLSDAHEVHNDGLNEGSGSEMMYNNRGNGSFANSSMMSNQKLHSVLSPINQMPRARDFGTNQEPKPEEGEENPLDSARDAREQQPNKVEGSPSPIREREQSPEMTKKEIEVSEVDDDDGEVDGHVEEEYHEEMV